MAAGSCIVQTFDVHADTRNHRIIAFHCFILSLPFFNIVFYFKVISLDIWICRGIIVYIWTKDILAYIFSWSGFRLQAILKALGSNLFWNHQIITGLILKQICIHFTPIHFKPLKKKYIYIYLMTLPCSISIGTGGFYFYFFKLPKGINITSILWPCNCTHARK